MLGKAIWRLRLQENPSADGARSAPNPAEGAYGAPANPIVSGEGLAVSSPRTPYPALGPSGLASPTPTPKLVPTPLQCGVFGRPMDKWEESLNGVVQNVRHRNQQKLCKVINYLWSTIGLVNMHGSSSIHHQ